MPISADLISAWIQDSSIGADRARSCRRLLIELEAWLGRPLSEIDAESLIAFLDARLAAGAHPNTVRKYVGMIRAFYRSVYEHGQVSADVYLAVRSVKPPRESTRRAQPQPYRRKELAAIWSTLEERWPKLPDDEAWHWINRWREGRSPYSRVRSHAIRCQLDAVISLVLYCGLRRSEIFRQEIDWMHDDNAYVMVWDEIGPWDGKVRMVHYTDSARALIAPWCRLRSAIKPEHPRAWLNLHAEPTVREPMTRDTFNKLLPHVSRPRMDTRSVARYVRRGLGKGWPPTGASAAGAWLLVARRRAAVSGARRR